jgi:5-methylcytosine-specific restriction protein A
MARRVPAVPGRIATFDGGPRAPASAPAPSRVSPARKWYSSARWARLRREVLARDGYMCRQTGVAVEDGAGGRAPWSAVVDHIRPHRGDPALFWDPANLQTVCKAWHDSEKQRLERRGLV